MLATSSAATRVRGFVALTKPRIIELLLVTTVPTMVLAERGVPRPWLVVATVVGGTLAAGGANAVNMYVDRDIDAVMDRTAGRPLVTGVVRPAEALAFAVLLEAGAFGWMWWLVNPLSAVLALSACLFYVFVYTLWLKRTSTQNIVIGGAAGAMPALIGWSAVRNELSWEPWLLFAIVFLWTPPHFWALAIRYKDDYARAGVPMLPAVASLQRTSREILAYTVATVGVSLVLVPVADLGAMYVAAASGGGAMMTWLSLGVLRDPQPPRAMRLFAFSITYLVLLFGAIAADVLVLG